MWTEWCADHAANVRPNWLADYQAAHRGLYGRYPSFARLMKNARIKDQLLVFDEL